MTSAKNIFDIKLFRPPHATQSVAALASAAKGVGLYCFDEKTMDDAAEIIRSVAAIIRRGEWTRKVPIKF